MTPESITSNAVAALQFIVEFAQADLDALPPREYLRMLKNLHAFIYRENPAGRAWSELSAMVPELQRRARGMLDDAARGGNLAIAGDLVLSAWVVATKTGARIQIVGHPLYLLLYQVAQVLAAVGLDRLGRCESVRRGRPCGRLFVRVTVKRFCSTRCQSRTKMKQIRDAQKEEQERAHAEAKRTRRR